MAAILCTRHAKIAPDATAGGGFKAFSDVAQDIRTVISTTEDLIGSAYDPVHDRLYYCSFVSIYRTDRQGRWVEIVLNDNNEQCK